MASTLSILVRVLGGYQGRNDKMVQFLLERRHQTEVEEEVSQYIVAASGFKEKCQRNDFYFGTGSMKHTLWIFRDHLEDFNEIADTILRMAIKGEVSLRKTRDDLVRLGVYQEYTHLLFGPPPDIESMVQSYHIGGINIGVNTTRLNLTKLVLEGGDFDVYVATSKRGSVIKARRPHTLDRLADWDHPYPDMLLNVDTLDVVDIVTEIPLVFRRKTNEDRDHGEEFAGGVRRSG